MEESETEGASWIKYFFFLCLTPAPGKVTGSRKPPIPLLETLEDWEAERKKQGARGWRVSTVNERFDMATR